MSAPTLLAQGLLALGQLALGLLAPGLRTPGLRTQGQAVWPDWVLPTPLLLRQQVPCLWRFQFQFQRQCLCLWHQLWRQPVDWLVTLIQLPSRRPQLLVQ